MKYVVISCRKCGKLYAARSHVKASKCPHCGYRNDMGRVKVHAKLDDVRRVPEVVAKLAECYHGKPCLLTHEESTLVNTLRR